MRRPERAAAATRPTPASSDARPAERERRARDLPSGPPDRRHCRAAGHPQITKTAPQWLPGAPRAAPWAKNGCAMSAEAQAARPMAEMVAMGSGDPDGMTMWPGRFLALTDKDDRQRSGRIRGGRWGSLRPAPADRHRPIQILTIAGCNSNMQSSTLGSTV